MNRLLVVIFLALSIQAKANDLGKFHFAVDYMYTLGISERVNGHTYTRRDVGMHGNALSLSALYDVNRAFSAGVGIVACAYEPNPSALPIFVSFRYRPFAAGSIKNLYAFTSVGYGIPMDDDDTLSSGFMVNIGVGWQKMFRKHFGLNFQFGYSFHQFRENYEYVWSEGYESWSYSKVSMGRNSLMLGVGLVF